MPKSKPKPTSNDVASLASSIQGLLNSVAALIDRAGGAVMSSREVREAGASVSNAGEAVAAAAKAKSKRIKTKVKGYWAKARAKVKAKAKPT